MTRKTTTKKSVTKGQLALVAILGMALVGVLASNLSSSEGETALATANEASAAAPAGAAVTAKPIDSPFGEFAEDRAWKPTPVAELVAIDPFADGVDDEPATPRFDDAELNELRNAQDAIVFTTDGQTVARVGAKEYRVGDMVGGLEVRDISSAGIVLGQRN